MQRSTNLNLYLPENGDTQDITQISWNFDTLDGAVLTKSSQTLTSTQKSNVRTNLGLGTAATKDSVNNLTTTASGSVLDARVGPSIAQTVYLESTDDTWAEIWGKISILPLAKPATLYVHTNAIGPLTGNAQTSGAWGGVISRTGTGSFSLILKSTNNQLRAASISGASSSSSGTYTEVNYYNKADGYVTLSGSSGTNTYAIEHDSRIRIDLITTNAARMGTILVSGNSSGTAAYFKADVGGSISVTANGANLIIETNNSISLFCTVYAGGITRVTT